MPIRFRMSLTVVLLNPLVKKNSSAVMMISFLRSSCYFTIRMSYLLSLNRLSVVVSDLIIPTAGLEVNLFF